MSPYKRLADERRDERRSIRDALEIFRSIPEYTDQSQAEIRVTELRLPSDENKVVGLVELEFAAHNGTVYLVSLPTSAQFSARTKADLRPSGYDIAVLDGGVVDAAGTVTLTDGRRLRAVEIIPTRALNQPTELDWRIVHHTISMTKKGKEHCYRSMKEQDLPRWVLRHMIPDDRFLDFGSLASLELSSSLKEIVGHLAEVDPTLKKISPQKVADALRKFGIRIPAVRSRRMIDAAPP